MWSQVPNWGEGGVACLIGLISESDAASLSCAGESCGTRIQMQCEFVPKSNEKKSRISACTYCVRVFCAGRPESQIKTTSVIVGVLRLILTLRQQILVDLSKRIELK